MPGTLSHSDIQIASLTNNAPLPIYNRHMKEYTLSRMKTIPCLSETNETGYSDYDNVPATGVLHHQDPGAPRCPTLQGYTRAMQLYTRCQILSSWSQRR